MKLNFAEKNAKNAVEYLLWAAKVNVTPRGVTDTLCLHPDYPSIAAVSDALAEWNVDNIATRLHIQQLKDIPLPALAYLTIKGGILAPIKSVADDNITWLDTQDGWKTEALNTFQQKWEGVVLLLEPNDQSGEIDYAKKKKEQWGLNARIPLLIGGTLLLLALLVVLVWPTPPSTNLLLLAGLKIAGTVLGGLLLWQSIESHNPFLQNLCQVWSVNNCNGILESNAAKLTPWLSWSDVGFLYFSGGLLTLVFGSLAVDATPIFALSALTLAALPYTFYSVYYQKIVAKQWCTLCMAAQVVLWMEGAWVIANHASLNANFSLQSIAMIGLAYLIPSLVWILVKWPFEQSAQVFGLRRELQKVKFSEQYIQAMFQNQRSMPPIFTDMHVVKLGKLDASHTLTVVTNPLCGPCAKTHYEIAQLLDKNRQFNLQFVFLGPPKAMQIAAKFLDAPSSQVSVMMDSWYQNNRQDAEKWLAQYPLKSEPENQKQLRLYARWCEMANIISTPTIFINGIQLPTAFQVKDLGNIVNVLEQTNNRVSIP
ncbi:vitamin K epoxide reductase family protein [Dyadobacter sp. MSC1_007]|jgi:uncharacterized membrane protein|uniref:vitamin K epoxide reductase family protein n=1 Tax=Dyadobacter sp. MSC1_007 TaxID=2909264 RepID=UPI002030203B|nr:vitamin K epoxide reductase family protein [Dyadobacter sp. MSC1_007]